MYVNAILCKKAPKKIIQPLFEAIAEIFRSDLKELDTSISY